LVFVITVRNFLDYC